MNEQRRAERIRVLGVQVDPVRMDRAASLTGRYLEKHKFEYIVFANTPAALAGQEDGLLDTYMRKAALVLPGDSNIEDAVEAGRWLKEGESYQAEYFRRIFSRLNRHRASIYIMVEEEDQLNKIRNIIREKYNRLEAETVLWETDGSVDQLVNSINSLAPTVLFICAAHERMSQFLREQMCKINAGICFCMEEVATDSETNIPEWMIGNRMQKRMKGFRERTSHLLHNLVFKKKMKQSMKEERTEEASGETGQEEESVSSE